MILRTMIARNVKIFFKDKGMFFTSLITPIILLVLYVTFLGNVYSKSFTGALPEGFKLADDIINATVGGQLLSSILAVCSVTTAFNSNMLMVQDKLNGARGDLNVSPVKNSTLALGYYAATVISTLIVSFSAMAACLIYVSTQGWFMSAADILSICGDVILLVLFGTALSSFVNLFVSSQGQVTAVGAIISAGYGFLCGAYMPIAQFSSGLQKVLSLLPGTHATVLLRNHAMRGAFDEMRSVGVPDDVVDGMMKGVDCKLSLFGNELSNSTMLIYLAAAIVVLIAAYIIVNTILEKKKVV